jgi:colanic acid biosynthesis glycosyl transferase WcaI
VTAASPGGGTHLLLPALKMLVRRIYRGCTRVLIQSRAFRPSIERFGIPPECIQYLPQSVSALFLPVAPDTDVPRAFTEPAFRVVFAGNIGQAQDFETVVEAAERLRNEPVRWVIVGDGRRRAWLAEEVKRRGLENSVCLTGSFPESRMPGFFAHADALLLTLRREPIFALTIPTKLQAYLACGKPVIAGMDGEAPRIIAEARAGVTAPAGDPEALAAAVLQLMRMPAAERQAMGARALAYSRDNFAHERLLEALVAYLRDAAATR